MKVKNIKEKYTQDFLISLGFVKRTDIRWSRTFEEYCYYGKEGKKGNQSPILVIEETDGTIYMWCPQTYYMREIPNVLLILIKNEMVEE